MSSRNSESIDSNMEKQRRTRLVSAAWRIAHHESRARSELGLVASCPNCRTPAQITDATSLTNIECDSCGSHFGIVPVDTEHRVGENIDCFELVELVGQGGFGCVWKAHDTELDRVVAIKVPRAGKMSAAESEQFFREARAAAQLQHPNIVSVHRIGSDENTFFIVSDLVNGQSLAEWSERGLPSFRKAAELCEKLADALHHAHECGVIHRDIKPQNILVDREAEPYLTDFGLARRELGETTLTLDGHVLGTPAFMSPEQAKGDSHRADRRSDIYSLGVVLFQLLTGEVPFRGAPRTVLKQVIQDDAPSLRRLNSSVPRDLENIVLKCLEKDPEKRYGTAQELAFDLRRFREGKPVRARPISLAARVARWCRRRPLTSSLVVALSLTGLVLSVGGPLMAMRQARLANEYRRFLYLSDLQSAADAISTGDQMRAHELLATYAREDRKELQTLEWHLLWQMCLGGSMTPDLWNGHDSLMADAKATRQIDFSPQADLAAAHFDGSVTIWRNGQLLHRLHAHKGYGQSAAFSTDGKLLATGGNDRKVRIWEVETGAEVAELVVDHEPWSLAFLDAEHLLVPSKDGVRRYQATSGRRIDVIPNSATFMGQSGSAAGRLAVSADRSLIAVVDRSCVRIIDLHTNELKGRWAEKGDEKARSICFSADNRYILKGGVATPTLRVWDIEAERLHCELDGHRRAIRAVCSFPHDPDIVASASWDKSVKLWSISRKSEVATLVGHSGQLFAMDVAPDGKSFVSGGIDGRLRKWNLDQVRNRRLLGHTKPVTDVTFHPSGTLLTAGSEGVIHWDTDSGTHLNRGPDVDKLDYNKVVCSPDGSRYVTFANTQEAILVQYQTQKVIRRFPSDSKLNCLAHAHDRGVVAVGSFSGDISVWDTESGRRLTKWKAHGKREGNSETLQDSNTNPWGHPDIVNDLLYLDDGTLVSLGGDRRMTLWKFARASANSLRAIQVRSQSIDDHTPLRLAFSTDRGLLAVSDEYGQPSLWSSNLSRRIKTWDADTRSGVHALAFIPSQNTLVTGGYEGDLRFWDANATVLRMTLRLDSDFKSIAVSPNGDRLAFDGRDGAVHLLTLK